MPQRHRGDEIIRKIRVYLKQAVTGDDAITDTLLMTVVGCSRRTFYKYVTEGSMIRQEIIAARKLQEENALKCEPGSGGKDLAKENARLRAERRQTQEAGRDFLKFVAQLNSNLIELGVSPKVIQIAMTRSMSKPDRSFSHAGHPRGRQRRMGRG